MVYVPKTQINDENVLNFLESIEDNIKKQDCLEILDMMIKISWEEAKMWWEAIIGFWSYSYESKSWCKWDWMRIAFSPRKSYISVYIMPWYHEFFWLLEKLWKHKAWKSCLNIKKLDDVDKEVLFELIKKWWDEMKKLYPIKK